MSCTVAKTIKTVPTIKLVRLVGNWREVQLESKFKSLDLYAEARKVCKSS